MACAAKLLVGKDIIYVYCFLNEAIVSTRVGPRLREAPVAFGRKAAASRTGTSIPVLRYRRRFKSDQWATPTCARGRAKFSL